MQSDKQPWTIVITLTTNSTVNDEDIFDALGPLIALDFFTTSDITIDIIKEDLHEK